MGTAIDFLPAQCGENMTIEKSTVCSLEAEELLGRIVREACADRHPVLPSSRDRDLQDQKGFPGSHPACWASRVKI